MSRATPFTGVLSDADVTLRARLLRMTDTRTTDRPLIEEALTSGSSAVRSAATLAIGQLRDVSLAPRARTLLTDGDTAVAASAAFALGLMRDTGSVDALRSALDREDAVAIDAAWALGEIGEPARATIELALAQRLEFARPPAGQAVQSRSRESTLALLLAASRLRPVPAVPIIALMGDGRDSVAWAASYALTRPRVPEASRALIRLVEAPNAMVRMQIARGLSKGIVGDSLQTEALAALLRLARDAEPHVRINAARSLATFGPVVADALVLLAGDADANVRIAAAQSLATAAPAGAEVWTRLWSGDSTMMFRKSLLESAARAGVSIAPAEQWRSVADWRYRAALTDAAAATTPARARFTALSGFLRDGDPKVRARAVAALSSVTDSVEEARASAERALEDSSALVRAAALSALQPVAAARSITHGVKQYRLAYDDRDDEVRRAALAYLAAAWRRDSAAFDDSIRDTLKALRPPREPSELAGIESSGAFASWRLAPRTARPLGWYENVVRQWVLPSLAAQPVRLNIRTERGVIGVELFGADAPITADNFAGLASRGYFRGTRFHRVVPNFVVQDGDPGGTGNGGPGYAIRDELNRRRYGRGIVGMALAGRDTGGSQWFITHSPQPHLDGGYTIFGRVVSGWEALDAIVQGDRIQDITRQ